MSISIYIHIYREREGAWYTMLYNLYKTHIYIYIYLLYIHIG